MRCRAMPLSLSEELNAGSCRSLLLSDVIARLRRMQGERVEPGASWDSFGAGVHIAAKNEGLAPQTYVRRTIAAHRSALERLDLLLDPGAMLDTSDPAHVKWIQELFVLLWRERPATLNEAKAHSHAYWDPGTKSNLALKQIVNGRGFFSGMLIEIREASSYEIPVSVELGERLLAGLERLVGWDDFVKSMQRESVGLEDGLRMSFGLFDPAHRRLEPLEIFTSRPDTLLGTTFIAVAADHPLARRIAHDSAAVRAFREEVMRPEYAYQRLGDDKSRDGVELGVYAVNPVNGDHIPVWATNFVVAGYGTGAALGIPGHDLRNHHFALRHNLPIRRVAVEDGADPTAPINSPYVHKQGRAVNSGALDAAINRRKSRLRREGNDGGGASLRAKQDWDRGVAEEVIAFLAERGVDATPATMARLRGWKISQQDCWGYPVPLVHCEACGTVPVPAAELPLMPPKYAEGKELLSDYPAFIACRCPRCGGKAERDADTLSSYFDAAVQHLAAGGKNMTWRGKAKARPVDYYCCGVEHATNHLLTARVIQRLLAQAGRLAGAAEPFAALLCQGTVLNYGLPMAPGYGNAVSVASLLDAYGADLLRLYVATAADPRHPLHWDESRLLALQGVIDGKDLAALRRGRLRGLKADKVANMLSPRELRRLREGLLGPEEYGLLLRDRLPAARLRKVKKIIGVSELARLREGMFSAAQLRRLRKGELTPAEQAAAAAEFDALELRRLRDGLLERHEFAALLRGELPAKRLGQVQRHWPAALLAKLRASGADPADAAAVAELQEKILTPLELVDALRQEQRLAAERKARTVLRDADVQRLRGGLLDRGEWKRLRQGKLAGAKMKAARELAGEDGLARMRGGLLDEDEFAALLAGKLPAARRARAAKLVGEAALRRLRAARGALARLPLLEKIMPAERLFGTLAAGEPDAGLRRRLLAVLDAKELASLRQAAAALPADGWVRLTAFVDERRMARLCGFVPAAKENKLARLLDAVELRRLREEARPRPPLLRFLPPARMDRLCGFIDESKMDRLVNHLDPERMELLLGFTGALRDLFARKDAVIRAGARPDPADPRRDELRRVLQALGSCYGLDRRHGVPEPQRALPRLRELAALLETACDPADAADAGFAREAARALLLAAHPLLPGLTAELWAAAGFKGQPLDAPWPQVAARKGKARARQTCIIQENGAKRLVTEHEAGLAAAQAKRLARREMARYVHDRGYPSYPRPGERILRTEHVERPHETVINFVLGPAR
ncbi:MAG: class I tRNA ligase family protein [Betaproteobacteria bacterium AqS2]|uniref:leucine--tRNA ligase n=1 Tax=Candidatus Amphirhobacter heronislandensis TaxID=1732024 RepID=A0A930UC25_9GAMM|nr:class I tRNA ligase family protein [Betaproteobacteria bacterium AqS2]